MKLTQLQAFLAVADAGNFSAAARRLGVQRSTVSRGLATLERELGKVLFERTTRRTALTADGEALRRELSPIVDEFVEKLARLSGQVRPGGELRVALSSDVVSILDFGFLTEFCRRFPDVRLYLSSLASFRELAEGGFDVALCSAPTRLPDSSLVARRLLEPEFRIYAAPSYLERCGTPRTMAETARHQWVEMAGAPGPAATSRRHPPRPRATCNDPLLFLQAVKAGFGLGLLTVIAAAPLVASGALAPVLPSFSIHIGGLYVVHPPWSQVSASGAAFLDHVAALTLPGLSSGRRRAAATRP
jgi:DNA-binding transcriptional LysR family regulator